MILNVSGRTDVLAFYSEWFANRIQQGYIDVRNPYYEKLVSRIYWDDVQAIWFCTKNPVPFLEKVDLIDKPCVFHITLTPYHQDIEVNVPDKKEIIKAIKFLSQKFGVDNVVVRYDPILLNEKYDLNYHIKAFNKLCQQLNNHVSSILISFVDEYKNVEKNYQQLNYRTFTTDDYQQIGVWFSKIARENNIQVFTCCEENNLVEYGFIKKSCMSIEQAYQLTRNKYKTKNTRANKMCECVTSVDIGYYNSCPHLCKYCYANYDETKVYQNYKKHDPNSSLLIGQLSPDDEIKIRK